MSEIVKSTLVYFVKNTRYIYNFLVNTQVYKPNIFTKIIEEQLNAHYVYKSDLFIVIKDVNPKDDIHLLIIPVDFFRDYKDFLTNSTKAHKEELLNIQENIIFNLEDYRLETNGGSYQEIGHFHFHIVGKNWISPKKNNLLVSRTMQLISKGDVLIFNKPSHITPFLKILINGIIEKKPRYIVCNDPDAAKLFPKILVMDLKPSQLVHIKDYKQPEKLILVTGTYGKTTTSLFLFYLLDQLGIKTCVTTSTYHLTNKNGFVEELRESVLTTNDYPYNLHFLDQNHQCQYAIIESSSHSIVNNRLGDLQFDVSVLTSFMSKCKHLEKEKQDYENFKIQLINKGKMQFVSKNCSIKHKFPHALTGENTHITDDYFVIENIKIRNNLANNSIFSENLLHSLYILHGIGIDIEKIDLSKIPTFKKRDCKIHLSQNGYNLKVAPMYINSPELVDIMFDEYKDNNITILFFLFSSIYANYEMEILENILKKESISKIILTIDHFATEENICKTKEFLKSIEDKSPIIKRNLHKISIEQDYITAYEQAIYHNINTPNNYLLEIGKITEVHVSYTYFGYKQYPKSFVSLIKGIFYHVTNNLDNNKQ